MNIGTKMVNNFSYAYHRKMADHYMMKCFRHIYDDSAAFNRYKAKWVYHMMKCWGTPIR